MREITAFTLFITLIWLMIGLVVMACALFSPKWIMAAPLALWIALAGGKILFDWGTK